MTIKMSKATAWTLVAAVLVCGLLPFAGGRWHGGLFFVLLVFGSIPFIFASAKWLEWENQHVKRVALAVCCVLLIGATAWHIHRVADTPKHREIWWRESPLRGLKGWWVSREVNDEKKVILSTFLRFTQDEVDQTVTRTEATFAGVKDTTDESRTFKYTVRKTGVTKEGFPFIEISLSGIDATWLAVLGPKEPVMDLYKQGLFVGRYAPVEF